MLLSGRCVYSRSMCPLSDESSANEEPLKHQADEASLQQLNDAFAEMLNSETEEGASEEIAADPGEGSLASEEADAQKSECFWASDSEYGRSASKEDYRGATFCWASREHVS